MGNKKTKNGGIIRSRDPGWDFENWLRYNLPWQLNLSPSKQVAVDMIFSQFATFVRTLAAVAPEEFEIFFNELIKRTNRVSKWRAPRGTKIIPNFYKGKIQTYPNGKTIYMLIEKPTKRSKN